MEYQKQLKEIKTYKTHWFYLIGFFLILFLPLLNLPPWFSPPSWGKTIVFKIILSILIFFFIWQLLKKQGQVRNFSMKNFGPVPKLLIALLGIFFLATLFSKEISFSFWGSPHRSGGFLNFAFYILFTLFAFWVLNSKDWKRLWDFSFIIGILVGLVAVFQKYELFGGFLIPYSYRPASTIGGPIFLAIYLLLLIFLSLSFAIKIRGWKRFFYIFCVLFFLFIIYLSGTRAAYLGVGIGILYFLFFYPSSKPTPISASIPIPANTKPIKKFRIKWLKVLAAIFLILGILIVWWLNKQPELPQFIAKNKLLAVPAKRLLIGKSISDALDARIPGWKVGLQAFKDRPILGYGPENFSIGFDKYYDPSMPYITQTIAGEGTGWWDRAHNFFLDALINAGVLGLAVYLSLFIFLIWQLQRLKKENPGKSVIYHGIQTTFIAYLAANFFSFDVFSTYLISFFLIGYSLHLMKQPKEGSAEPTPESPSPEISQGKKSAIAEFLHRYRGGVLFVLFLIMIWFFWSANIKPFYANSQTNLADYQSFRAQCLEAVAKMEKALESAGIISHYLRLKFVDLIGRCVSEQDPVQAYKLSLRAFELLKENTEMMPTYTRNWILLGIYSNYLAEKIQETEPEKGQEFLKQANLAFEKAQQLSPKRQEVFLEWLKTDLLSGDPEKAKERAQQCLAINREFTDCYWMLGISNLYLNNLDEAKENMEIAKERNYPVDSELSLLQQAKAYIVTLNYQELIKIYHQLIKIKPGNPQYYASLATCYREAGDFENARKYALKLLELVPQSKEEVDEFLRTLR